MSSLRVGGRTSRRYNRGGMQTEAIPTCAPTRARHRTALAALARHALWALAATAVILGAQVGAGHSWPVWALGAAAALSGLRELYALYVRPLPADLRAAIERGADARVEDLARFAESAGLRRPRIVLRDKEAVESPTACYLVRGKPLFVLDEGLLPLLGERERRAVFAHELAHHLLGHVRRFALAAVAAHLAAVGVACVAAAPLATPPGSIRDIAGAALTALLALTAARTLLHPLLLAYARRQELQADREALRIAGDLESLMSAYRKIAAYQQADAAPAGWVHRMLSDSPSLSRRLAAIGKYAASRPEIVAVLPREEASCTEKGR